MEDVKFIGCANGVNEKTGRPWYMIFIARFSDKYNTWTCWSSTSVEEYEFSEFASLKFGDSFKAHFFNGMLKSYVLPAIK